MTSLSVSAVGPRRSKRLSSMCDDGDDHGPADVDADPHTVHRSAKKSQRIEHRADTNNNSNNKATDRRAPLCDITNDCAADTSFDSVSLFALDDVPSVDTTDDDRHDRSFASLTEDEDEDDGDDSADDRSFDEDDMLFSANKQRQQHTQHLQTSTNTSTFPKEACGKSDSQSSSSSASLSLLSSVAVVNTDSHSSSVIAPPTGLGPHSTDATTSQFTPHFCLAEYGDALHRYLRRNEEKFLCNPRYMTAVQSDLSFAMRSILIDWLIEVCEEYNLSTQTLYLGVAYIDRFLSQHPIERSKLQLIGVTAVFVAAKYWEIRPPMVEDFVYISDNTYNRDQIIAMERILLNTLQFNLASATCWDFHRRYVCSVRLGTIIELFSDMCMELLVCDAVYVTFKPSIIAAASLLYATHTVNGEEWSEALALTTRYQASELTECATAMRQLHCKQFNAFNKHAQPRSSDGKENDSASVACAASGVHLKAVMIKYSKQVYGNVVAISPRLS